MNRRGASIRKWQSGVAAVELAIVLPLLMVILMEVVFFGRLLMAYTVVQKSAQAAARYMSMVRVEEMKSRDLSTAASNAGINIAHTMLADLHLNGAELIDVQCDTVTCGGGSQLPQEVRVTIRCWLTDDIFNWVATGDYGLKITAQVTMKYIGY
ncbi:MAG: TadE/TadG family type IV pilus assembly protein [Gammaproteobacteria bacterium]